MTSERWRKIKEVVSAAADIPAAERGPYLDEACRGDPALRREAESLLEHIGPGFMDSQALGAAIEDPGDDWESWKGQRIGPYEIVDEIGRGGMGCVYRAVRADDQYQKQVAIKLVRNGLCSQFFVERFRNERQILASLEHPNIVRLLDGGTTHNGLPYLVMEYMPGEPLDAYCNHHGLNIPERLKLFQTVCSAVQFAHQRLVVHRDIKPANIIVTPEGAPKLVDFGIAKIIDPSSPQIETSTRAWLRMLTPEYASPEQLKGEPVTTASDIYSLGVVLYQLLTGCLPYRASTGQPLDVILSVCDREPIRPSSAVKVIGRQNSQTTPPSPALDSSLLKSMGASGLSRRLKGDLDAIVLKALRKEPQQRYAAASEFERDLERSLQGLPVLAHKGTRAYRGRKFLRRHRAGVAVAAVVFLICAASMMAILHEVHVERVQRAQAERRFNDVRGLAHTMIFDLHDAIKDLPGSTPARKLIVEKALVYLGRMSQHTGNNPDLQRELAAAYQRVGDVQGNPFFANLGDEAGALKSYAKALAIDQSLRRALPRDRGVLRALSDVYTRIGYIDFAKGDLHGNLENSRKAEALEERALPAHPAVADRFRLAIAIGNTATASEALGNFDSALAAFERCQSLFQGMMAEEPANPKLPAGMAAIEERIASVYVERNDLPSALAYQQKGITAREALLKSNPSSATDASRLALSYRDYGWQLKKAGRARDGVASFSKCIRIASRLSAADPANVQARQRLGECYAGRANARASAARFSEAVRDGGRSMSIFKKLLAANPSDDVAQGGMADAEEGTGLAETGLAKTSAASAGLRLRREGCSWLGQSLASWKKSQAQGTLDANQAGELSRVSHEFAGCRTRPLVSLLH